MTDDRFVELAWETVVLSLIDWGKAHGLREAVDKGAIEELLRPHIAKEIAAANARLLARRS